MRRTEFLWGRPAATALILGLCLSLLVLGLISECQPWAELDSSLLTGDPCAPPCWHNIAPGVADEDDVRSQLESSPFVEKGTLHYNLTEEAGVPLVGFSWQAREGDYICLQNGMVWPMERCNYIYLRDGKVLRIEISLHGGVTLGEIVDKYGPPERISAFVSVTDFYWYQITIDYPCQGLRLESFSLIDPKEVASGTISVTRDMRITDARYYVPTSLEKALSEAFWLPPDRIADYMASSQEWAGFGRIKIAGWGE